MIVVVNNEDSPLVPEGSSEDDGRDITIPVVGVPSSAGEHFEPFDRARLGLDYTFDPDFDSMTMREYASLTGDTEEWIDDSVAEKARHGAETVEVARFELQRGRERLRTAQERKQAADRALRSAAGRELPADSDLDSPTFSPGTDFQGLIQEEEERLREAQHQLGLLQAEAELRQRKFDEVMKQFDEHTEQLQKEKTDDYHADRKRLEERLIADPSSLDLQRELHAVEREYAGVQEEMRREKARLKQSYDQQLAAKQERHREEAEAWKNQEKEAHAQLARLRNKREQLAIEMRHGTQAMLVDFESQIAEVKGKLLLNQEAGEDRDHEAITVAEIAREPLNIKSADQLVQEATERAKAAQRRAAEKRELMQREEEKIVQTLAKPPRFREAPAERQRRIQGAVMIRRKIEGRHLTACFKSWVDFWQRRAISRAPNQEPVLSASPRSPVPTDTESSAAAAAAAAAALDGNMRVTDLARPAPSPEPPQLQRRRVDRELKPDQHDQQHQPWPEPQPELYLEAEPEQTYHHSKRQPELKPEPETPKTSTKSARTTHQRANQSSERATSHTTGVRQWKLTAKEGMYLTRDMVKQRRRHADDRIQKLERGTEIVELERQQVQAAEISTRRPETRLKCEVVFPRPASESERLTGWVDMDIRRKPAWKEVPCTLRPQRPQTNARSRSHVADASRSPSGRAAGGSSSGKSPWDSDEEDEAGADVATPIAEDAFPKFQSSQGQAEDIEQWAHVHPRTSSSTEQRAQAQSQWDQATRSEAAKALIAAQLAEARAQKLEEELAETRAALYSKSKTTTTKKKKKKQSGGFQVPRVGKAEVIRGGQVGSAQVNDDEARAVEAMERIKNQLEGNNNKPPVANRSPSSAQRQSSRGSPRQERELDQTVFSSTSPSLQDIEAEAERMAAEDRAMQAQRQQRQRQRSQRGGNYEDSYDMPRGSATLDQVAQSSAGVGGWAAADPTPDDTAAWERGRRTAPVQESAGASPLRDFRGSPTRRPPALESVRGGRAVSSWSARAGASSAGSPKAVLAVTSPTLSARSPLSPAESDWRESVDRMSGKRLWVNVRTMETTWVDPRSDRGGASPISPSAYSPGSPGSRPPLMRISARSVLSASD